MSQEGERRRRRILAFFPWALMALVAAVLLLTTPWAKKQPERPPKPPETEAPVFRPEGAAQDKWLVYLWRIHLREAREMERKYREDEFICPLGYWLVNWNHIGDRDVRISLTLASPTGYTLRFVKDGGEIHRAHLDPGGKVKIPDAVALQKPEVEFVPDNPSLLTPEAVLRFAGEAERTKNMGAALAIERVAFPVREKKGIDDVTWGDVPARLRAEIRRAWEAWPGKTETDAQWFVGQVMLRLAVPDGRIRNDIRYEVMTRDYEFAHDLWAWEGTTHRIDLVVPWEMTFAVQFWSPSAYTFVPVVDGAPREDRAVTVQPGEFARVVLPDGTQAIEARGTGKTVRHGVDAESLTRGRAKAPPDWRMPSPPIDIPAIQWPRKTGFWEKPSRTRKE